MTPSFRGPHHKEAPRACQARAAAPGPPNLARRIKRRAWAPEWNWFATCAPGLEELLAGELKALGLAVSGPEPGGVGFAGKLEAGYLANLWLRTAGRVLLRLADFRVRRWEDLRRQARQVAWEVFVPAGAPLKVRVSLKGSNLKHAGRVAEEVLAAATSSLQKAGLAPPRPCRKGEAGQLVLVRARDRRCQISLDASGEHLHKRGYRLEVAKAPLREDLAAALLLLAGYQGGETLLDPMCGSGTLAVEAALLARRLPPLGRRPLAMEAWPCHRQPAWRHLRARAGEQALAEAPAPIHARDRVPGALRATAGNARRAGVAGDLALEQADFFAAPPPGPGPGLVVMNPPYGKRLGSVRRAGSLAARLGRRLGEAYGGWRVAAVLYLPQWVESLGLEETRTLSLPFGGLKVTLVVGRVPA